MDARNFLRRSGIKRVAARDERPVSIPCVLRYDAAQRTVEVGKQDSH